MRACGTVMLERSHRSKKMNLTTHKFINIWYLTSESGQASSRHGSWRLFSGEQLRLDRPGRSRVIPVTAMRCDAD
jgi:hypothetical protein